MISRIVFLAGLFGLVSVAAVAQAPAPALLSARPADSFKHLTPAQQAALVNKPGPAPVISVMADHENWFIETIARTESGVVELHEHWIDVMTVMSGDATITYGGAYTGGKPTTPGELRGGKITGGTAVAVHPGDFIEIPAGIPHLTSLAPGARFRVLVIKMRQ